MIILYFVPLAVFIIFVIAIYNWDERDKIITNLTVIGAIFLLLAFCFISGLLAVQGLSLMATNA